MKQTRLGVFETNSSSMHSIVVMKNVEKFAGQYEKFDTDIFLDKNGKWTMWTEDLEYGRYPFQVLATFRDKLLYAIPALCNNKNKYDDIVEVVKKYIPKFRKFDFSMRDDGEKFGYIDHQSADLLYDFLNEEGITLEEFLTNKKYMIVIDGDEYAEFEKWVKSGLINVDDIDYTYCWGVKRYAKDIAE